MAAKDVVILSDGKEAVNKELTEVLVKTLVLQPPPPMPFEERRMLPCGFGGKSSKNRNRAFTGRSKKRRSM